jgi:hypothetical protein
MAGSCRILYRHVNLVLIVCQYLFIVLRNCEIKAERARYISSARGKAPASSARGFLIELRCKSSPYSECGISGEPQPCEADVKVTRDLIGAGQEQHHCKVSFQDELRLLLKRYELSYDERYVWD